MRNSHAMLLLRNAVKMRDGLACAECGSTETLQVHHVPTPDGRTVAHPEWMVTLCARCHAEPSGIA
jgi:5-methylcytosine-specific restriction endonuclease McrA